MKCFLALALCLVMSSALTAQVDSLSFINRVQSSSPKAQPTSAGVWIDIQEPGTGPIPKIDEFVQFSYVAAVLGGKTFDKTTEDEPFVCQPGDGAMIEGIDRVLSQLHVGTKCRVFVPPHLGFGATAVGQVPPHSLLVYDLHIESVLSAEQYEDILLEVENRERAAFEKREQAYFDEHKRKINDYAIGKKLKVTRTASGMSYIVDKPGKGAYPQPGDSVFVQYQGYLIEGDKLFDGTKGKNVFGFEVGNNGVIKGWDEGIRFFNTGASGWLLIPARLGYGASALNTKAGTLPPWSPLAFQIKVVQIKPATP